ncbi:MAG: hypothetical protein WDN31_11735 [Hyphomicrobium sp.]
MSLSVDAVRQAAKKNVFSKSLKTQAKLPEDLAGLTRGHLEQRLLGALGLARKAGQLVTGATRVKGRAGVGRCHRAVHRHRCGGGRPEQDGRHPRGPWNPGFATPS